MDVSGGNGRGVLAKASESAPRRSFRTRPPPPGRVGQDPVSDVPPTEMRHCQVFILFNERLEDPLQILWEDRFSLLVLVARHGHGWVAPMIRASGFLHRPIPRCITGAKALASRLTAGLPRRSSAWFKSWVFQVTVRTVPMPRRWKFFLSSDRWPARGRW